MSLKPIGKVGNKLKFSAKSEYGVRAILDIALTDRQGRGPIQVKEIARRQIIPERFLEQVMAGLKKAGLVESLRGAQGGYVLARPAGKISLADIIQAMEGPLTLMECVSEDIEARCSKAELCVIRDVWKNVQSAILEALDSITIEEICKKKRRKDGSITNMYHI